jgi:Lar family restriction alleviation protein
MTKLKPCPFCGSENVKFKNYGRGDTNVQCLNCRVYIEADKLNEDAAEKWNKRAGINKS